MWIVQVGIVLRKTVFVVAVFVAVVIFRVQKKYRWLNLLATTLKYLMTSVVVFTLINNESAIESHANRNIFDKENLLEFSSKKVIFVSKVVL